MKGKRKGEAVGKHSNFPSHHRSFLLPNYPDTSLCYLVSSATTCGYVCLHKREKGTIRFFFCNFFLFLKKTFEPDPPPRHRCGPFCVPPRKGEKRKEKKRRKKCRFIGGERGPVERAQLNRAEAGKEKREVSEAQPWRTRREHCLFFLPFFLLFSSFSPTYLPTRTGDVEVDQGKNHSIRRKPIWISFR